MSIFTEIERKYNWKLIAEPLRLDGGFMHRMYKMETEQGTYALKLLNPFVMQRETAMENYARAEQIEASLEQQGIPILPALSFGGRKMQEIDGVYFYLFDYFAGKPLKSGAITEFHCREIGTALARIHRIGRTHGDEHLTEMSIDQDSSLLDCSLWDSGLWDSGLWNPSLWNYYLTEMKKCDMELYEMLEECLPVLEKSQNRGSRARKKLPKVLSVCHNDMDCKNVLWKGEEYRIIDLECLSYGNPFTELFELALCWSGFEDCRIDFRLFQAFLRAYQNAGGELPADWELLYDCNISRLEWLEYNVKRVLGIDCGANEKEIGAEQVAETVLHIVYYSNMKEQILEHCVV